MDAMELGADPRNDNAPGQRRKVGKAKSTREHSNRSTATEAQIDRLISCLRCRPHHTHELRRIGISHPAGRVKDLANRGFDIASDRINTVDGDGYTHMNVARYALISEPDGAGRAA